MTAFTSLFLDSIVTSTAGIMMNGQRLHNICSYRSVVVAGGAIGLPVAILAFESIQFHMFFMLE